MVAVVGRHVCWHALGRRGGPTVSNQLSLLIALANLWFCGRAFYTNAVRQLRHAMANMDVLVALSTLVAFLLFGYNTFWGDPPKPISTRVA